MFANECKELQQKLVATRRELHQIPELSQDLPQTQAYVAGKLDELGITYTRNAGGDYGIIGYINKGKAGKCVALRADMDALPIKEENEVDYKSTNGRMHACGHDCHITMLLGAAEILKKHEEELAGEVRLIFQTGEETCKGAAAMLENHAMDGVDAIFGTHIGCIIDKTIPSGKMIITPGPIMASFDRFVIHVKGIGCHGSTPEKGIDPINIAAHIVLGLEAINAREFNANVPVVVTLGMIKGGAAYNAIPSEVTIEGTTRAFNEEVRRKIAERIAVISENTAIAFGGSAEVEMDWGAPAVINNIEMAAFAADCAADVVGEDQVIRKVPAPNMAGEDFAFYLGVVPGAFMFLSSSDPVKKTDVAHHNPRFQVDEDVLWEGSAVFTRIAEKFLNS